MSLPLVDWSRSVYADHVRPAMPGCSIGTSRLGRRTAPSVCSSRSKQPKGPGLFILSNSHVLALDGLAAVGDDVVQPGPDDVDGASGTIAKLADWVPFNFTTTGWPNLVDAAIARVKRSGRRYEPHPRDQRRSPCDELRNHRRDDACARWGEAPTKRRAKSSTPSGVREDQAHEDELDFPLCSVP